MEAADEGFGFWDALLAELAAAAARRERLSYRQLIECLHLPSPAMRPLTAALERLIALDAAAARPLRAALVVSQAGSGLPRTGFFERAAALGACPRAADEAALRRWHAAELARVFAFDYPAGSACARDLPSG